MSRNPKCKQFFNQKGFNLSTQAEFPFLGIHHNHTQTHTRFTGKFCSPEVDKTFTVNLPMFAEEANSYYFHHLSFTSKLI